MLTNIVSSQAHAMLEEIDGDGNQGTGVEVGVAGGEVAVVVDMWAMAPSISPPCPTNAVFKSDDEGTPPHHPQLERTTSIHSTTTACK